MRLVDIWCGGVEISMEVSGWPSMGYTQFGADVKAIAVTALDTRLR